MSIRRIGVILVSIASLAGLLLTVTGIDRDGSYWRGTGLVLLLIAVAVLILGEIIAVRRK
ncbi:MAG: hypothetical protein WBA68_05415 [Alteraurantiacibacter sp.]